MFSKKLKHTLNELRLKPTTPIHLKTFPRTFFFQRGFYYAKLAAKRTNACNACEKSSKLKSNLIKRKVSAGRGRAAVRLSQMIVLIRPTHTYTHREHYHDRRTCDYGRGWWTVHREIRGGPEDRGTLSSDVDMHLVVYRRGTAKKPARPPSFNQQVTFMNLNGRSRAHDDGVQVAPATTDRRCDLIDTIREISFVEPGSGGRSASFIVSFYSLFVFRTRVEES